MYKNILIVLIFNLVGKGVVLIRETQVAGIFGANAMTDAYNIATQLNSMIGNVFAESITACFIPILGKLYGKNSKSNDNLTYINKFSSMMIVLVCGLSIAIFLIAELNRSYIVRMLAPGFKDERFDYAVSLVAITLLVILVVPLTCIFNGILSLNEQFAKSSAATLILNFPPVIYLAFKRDIYGFIYCFVAGYVMQALYLCLSMSKIGFKFKFYFNFKDDNFRKFLDLLGPVLISFGVTEINTLIDRMMASTLDSGQLSLYSYASKLENMIHVILSTCFITVLFSTIAKLDSSSKEFRDTVSETTTNMLYILIPIMMIAIFLSDYIISFVFERNNFTAYDRYISANIFMILGFGIAIFPFRDLLNRICYATNDTKNPIKCSIVSVSVNIVGNIVLVKIFGIYGLPIATIIASIISVILMKYYMSKNNIQVLKKNNVMDVLKIIVCSMIVALIGVLIKSKINYFKLNFIAKFFCLACLASGAFGVYAVLSIILKVRFAIQSKNTLLEWTNYAFKSKKYK